MKSKKVAQRSYYPCLRGAFGNWVYYSCLMSAGDVARRVSFADEIHPNKALSQLIQRELKDKRAKEIGDYIRREDFRFFNSMVVAVYGGEPTWHGFSNFRPQADDIDLSEVPEDAEDSVGFLSFTGDEKLFALDGQHRLAGIKNALEGNSEFAAEDVSMLLVAHTNTKEGLKRTRQLFTTLNKTARPVGKGEIIALDENDTMAIVSRRLFDFDPHFSEKRIKFAQSDSVAASDTQLTTIGNLYDVLSALFTKYPTPKPKHELQYIRPTDEELQQYLKTATEFFDGLASHFRPLGEYFRASEERAPLIVRKNRTANGGHVRDRPVGLRIFAEVAMVAATKSNDLKSTLNLMANLPTELSDAPYAEIIWRNGKIVAGGRALARDLILYMLGLRADKGLRERIAKTRGIQPGSVRLPARV